MVCHAHALKLNIRTSFDCNFLSLSTTMSTVHDSSTQTIETLGNSAKSCMSTPRTWAGFRAWAKLQCSCHPHRPQSRSSNRAECALYRGCLRARNATYFFKPEDVSITPLASTLTIPTSLPRRTNHANLLPLAQ